MRKPLSGLIAWDLLPPAGLGDDVVICTDGSELRYRDGEWVEA